MYKKNLRKRIQFFYSNHTLNTFVHKPVLHRGKFSFFHLQSKIKMIKLYKTTNFARVGTETVTFGRRLSRQGLNHRSRKFEPPLEIRVEPELRLLLAATPQPQPRRRSEHR